MRTLIGRRARSKMAPRLRMQPNTRICACVCVYVCVRVCVCVCVCVRAHARRGVRGYGRARWSKMIRGRFGLSPCIAPVSVWA